MSVIASYFEKIAATFKGGQATEQSYRPVSLRVFIICSCYCRGRDLACEEESWNELWRGR